MSFLHDSAALKAINESCIYQNPPPPPDFDWKNHHTVIRYLKPQKIASSNIFQSVIHLMHESLFIPTNEEIASNKNDETVPQHSNQQTSTSLEETREQAVKQAKCSSEKTDIDKDQASKSNVGKGPSRNDNPRVDTISSKSLSKIDKPVPKKVEQFIPVPCRSKNGHKSPISAKRTDSKPSLIGRDKRLDSQDRARREREPERAKKHLVLYSSSDEEGPSRRGDDSRKSRRARERHVKKSFSDDEREEKHVRRRRRSGSKEGYDYINDLESYKECRKISAKEEPKASPQQAYEDDDECALDVFYCKICKLSLNSQATWDSHINGKKHLKAIKALNVKDIAQASINDPPPRPAFDMSSFQNEESAKRTMHPAPGYKRIEIPDRSSIQKLCDEIREYPVPGLKYVIEIRLQAETVFFCSLCEAPCQPVSIMSHLKGFKHYLRCLEKIDVRLYERFKERPKRDVENKVKYILFEDEDKYGRGKIKVVKDIRMAPEDIVPLVYPDDGAAGPSWGVHNFAMKIDVDDDAYGKPIYDEYLDISSGDFRCKVCMAHMNNPAMWEAHIKGKRHLKNVKKIPGEFISKLKFIEAAPETRSFLLAIIARELPPNKIIVGLRDIKETHNENGVTYTCYPCGAHCTDVDILNHLQLIKHKIKYLERLNADGHHNSIMTINELDINEFARTNLVDEQCEKMLEKLGPGQPQIFVPKT